MERSRHGGRGTIELHLPPDLVIGGGTSDDLAEHVARIGIERPLVVSDRFLLEKGPAGPLVERLRAAGAAVATFGDVQPDPTLDNVNGAGAARARGRRRRGDRGGSPMDTAKAAAVAFANEGDVRDYAGYHQVPGAGLPLVAVPTTAGTRQRGHAGRRHHRRRPRREDDDARRPPDGPGGHLRLQADAEHAGRADLVGRRGLAHARDRGLRLQARDGAAAFSNSSVALVHGMSRPIGAHFHLAHGLSNALLLPAVTRFSVAGAPDRYANVAREMDLAGAEDSDEAACQRLVEELEALNADLRIPSLSGADVDREHFDRVVQDMAQAALDSGRPGFNPRAATKEEIVELYNQAF